MTYRGQVKGGQITLEGAVRLPEGALVQVEVLESSSNGQERCTPGQLSELLMRHAGTGGDLPTDLAENHDHYAHGKPKR